MGVILDFDGVTLDGVTPRHIAYESFDQDGVSPVYSFTAKSSDSNEYRPSPNDVEVYDPNIRVGLSEAACLAAAWGARLPVYLDLTPVGFTVYIQFRRVMDSTQVDLTDKVGMANSGFLVLDQAAAMGQGNTLSSGSGLVSQTAPAQGVGSTVTSGLGAATTEGAVAAEGIGNTTSSGEGSAAQTAPAQGVGETTSSGVGAATAVSGPSYIPDGTWYSQQTSSGEPASNVRMLDTTDPTGIGYFTGWEYGSNAYVKARCVVLNMTTGAVVATMGSYVQSTAVTTTRTRKSLSLPFNTLTVGSGQVLGVECVAGAGTGGEAVRYLMFPTSTEGMKPETSLTLRLLAYLGEDEEVYTEFQLGRANPSEDITDVVIT